MRSLGQGRHARGSKGESTRATTAEASAEAREQRRTGEAGRHAGVAVENELLAVSADQRGVSLA